MMNTKLILMSLFIAMSIGALAAMPTLVSSQPVLADNDKKDSPSDDDNGGGNDPPNNRNHRGNN